MSSGESPGIFSIESCLRIEISALVGVVPFPAAIWAASWAGIAPPTQLMGITTMQPKRVRIPNKKADDL
jgi:hypothetical protein